MQNKSGFGGISQTEFISILFADTGYTTSAQRKGWLQVRFQKSYADELTKAEASRAIEMLKNEKASPRTPEDDEVDD